MVLLYGVSKEVGNSEEICEKPLVVVKTKTKNLDAQEAKIASDDKKILVPKTLECTETSKSDVCESKSKQPKRIYIRKKLLNKDPTRQIKNKDKNKRKLITPYDINKQKRRKVEK